MITKAENLSLNDKFCLFQICKNFICVRFLDESKEKFELEFNLEKGTSFNSFLIVTNEKLFIIFPPEINNLELFKKFIIENINDYQKKQIKIITGHINPKIIESIKGIITSLRHPEIICTNPGCKLITELWNQKKPKDNNFDDVKLPKFHLIKKESQINVNQLSLELIPAPTARWP